MYPGSENDPDSSSEWGLLVLFFVALVALALV